jgi:hypothetical protein
MAGKGGHLRLPPDEPGQLRQVGEVSGEGPQRREVGRQTRDEQLEQLHRSGQVLQLMVTKIAQVHPDGSSPPSSSWVACESRTRPPWPAAQIRAARCTSRPA